MGKLVTKLAHNASHRNFLTSSLRSLLCSSGTNVGNENLFLFLCKSYDKIYSSFPRTLHRTTAKRFPSFPLIIAFPRLERCVSGRSISVIFGGFSLASDL